MYFCHNLNLSNESLQKIIDIEGTPLQIYNGDLIIENLNDFLNNILGVTQIVVESCQLSQQQGLRNVQYFQLSCVSDIDYTITKTTKDV